MEKAGKTEQKVEKTKAEEATKTENTNIKTENTNIKTERSKSQTLDKEVVLSSPPGRPLHSLNSVSNSVSIANQKTGETSAGKKPERKIEKQEVENKRAAEISEEQERQEIIEEKEEIIEQKAQKEEKGGAAQKEEKGGAAQKEKRESEESVREASDESSDDSFGDVAFALAADSALSDQFLANELYSPLEVIPGENGNSSSFVYRKNSAGARKRIRLVNGRDVRETGRDGRKRLLRGNVSSRGVSEEAADGDRVDGVRVDVDRGDPKLANLSVTKQITTSRRGNKAGFWNLTKTHGIHPIKTVNGAERLRLTKFVRRANANGNDQSGNTNIDQTSNDQYKNNIRWKPTEAVVIHRLRAYKRLPVHGANLPHGKLPKVSVNTYNKWVLDRREEEIRRNEELLKETGRLMKDKLLKENETSRLLKESVEKKDRVLAAQEAAAENDPEKSGRSEEDEDEAERRVLLMKEKRLTENRHAKNVKLQKFLQARLAKKIENRKISDKITKTGRRMYEEWKKSFGTPLSSVDEDGRSFQLLDPSELVDSGSMTQKMRERTALAKKMQSFKRQMDFDTNVEDGNLDGTYEGRKQLLETMNFNFGGNEPDHRQPLFHPNEPDHEKPLFNPFSLGNDPHHANDPLLRAFEQCAALNTFEFVKPNMPLEFRFGEGFDSDSDLSSGSSDSSSDSSDSSSNSSCDWADLFPKNKGSKIKGSKIKIYSASSGESESDSDSSSENEEEGGEGENTESIGSGDFSEESGELDESGEFESGEFEIESSLGKIGALESRIGDLDSEELDDLLWERYKLKRNESYESSKSKGSKLSKSESKSKQRDAESHKSEPEAKSESKKSESAPVPLYLLGDEVSPKSPPEPSNKSRSDDSSPRKRSNEENDNIEKDNESDDESASENSHNNWMERLFGQLYQVPAKQVSEPPVENGEGGDEEGDPHEYEIANNSEQGNNASEYSQNIDVSDVTSAAPNLTVEELQRLEDEYIAIRVPNLVKESVGGSFAAKVIRKLMMNDKSSNKLLLQQIKIKITFVIPEGL